MLEEQWVEIEGLPRYSVSSYGRVINNDTGRELKQYTNRGGFKNIVLQVDYKKHRFMVHRLVARHFFLNYTKGIAVEFKNGDRQDCSVLNLTLSGKNCRQGDIP